MGIRGELYSAKVSLPNRTYFFNVKENRLGDLYLNIVESKNRETGGFDRQSVVLFADDLGDFLKGFDESLRVLEKAVREKKHSRPAPPRSAGEGRREGPPRGGDAEGEIHRKRIVKRGPKKDTPPRGEEGPRKGRPPRTVRAVRTVRPKGDRPTP